jgi:uncharacterized membrane protein
MGFCAKCGATLTEGSGYCGSCGSQVAPGIQGEASGPQIVTTSPLVSSTGLTSNIAGALAYVLGPITGIVFLVLEPYTRDRFVRFQPMQSVLFCVAAFVFSIAWGIVVNHDQHQRMDCGSPDPDRSGDFVTFFLILAFPDVSGVQPARVSHSVHRRDCSQAGGGLANHHNRSMQLWNN